MPIQFNKQGTIILNEQIKAEIRSNPELAEELIFMSQSSYYDGSLTQEAMELAKELRLSRSKSYWWRKESGVRSQEKKKELKK